MNNAGNWLTWPVVSTVVRYFLCFGFQIWSLFLLGFFPVYLCFISKVLSWCFFPPSLRFLFQVCPIRCDRLPHPDCLINHKHTLSTFSIERVTVAASHSEGCSLHRTRRRTWSASKAASYVDQEGQNRAPLNVQQRHSLSPPQLTAHQLVVAALLGHNAFWGYTGPRGEKWRLHLKDLSNSWQPCRAKCDVGQQMQPLNWDTAHVYFGGSISCVFASVVLHRFNIAGCTHF